MSEITEEDLLYAYVNGAFPMAEADGTIYWYSPDPRAIIPIETYKPAKSLRSVLNKQQFEIRVNTSFEQVMRGCAAPRGLETETWISDEIIAMYVALHEMGFAHSVEAFQDDKLVGGLYGVGIGAAFFGESMFYTVPNSSKVAFHYLIEILRKEGFILLDSQFMNDNVKRYGAIEITKKDYLNRLKKAVTKPATFQLAL